MRGDDDVVLRTELLGAPAQQREHSRNLALLGLAHAAGVDAVDPPTRRLEQFDHRRSCEEPQVRAIEDPDIPIRPPALEHERDQHGEVPNVRKGRDHATPRAQERLHVLQDGPRVLEMFEYVIEHDAVEQAIRRISGEPTDHHAIESRPGNCGGLHIRLETPDFDSGSIPLQTEPECTERAADIENRSNGRWNEWRDITPFPIAVGMRFRFHVG